MNYGLKGSISVYSGICGDCGISWEFHSRRSAAAAISPGPGSASTDRFASIHACSRGISRIMLRWKNLWHTWTQRRTPHVTWVQLVIHQGQSLSRILPTSSPLHAWFTPIYVKWKLNASFVMLSKWQMAPRVFWETGLNSILCPKPLKKHTGRWINSLSRSYIQGMWSFSRGSDTFWDSSWKSWHNFNLLRTTSMRCADSTRFIVI